MKKRTGEPWIPATSYGARRCCRNSAALQDGRTRGLGAELRLLGMYPEEVAGRARPMKALFKDVSVRGHGWREVMVRDPDGYVWAVGEIDRDDG